MPTISANGETIFYTLEGSGPVVTFIHSLGSSIHMWREQIDAFKNRHTVLVMDCRGHGGSSANNDVTLEGMASDLRAVLGHLNISRCHLVGMEMGGSIALLFNSRWPEVAQSMVLAAPCLRLQPGSEESVAATKEAIAYISMQEFGNQYAAQRLHPSTSLDVQDELAACVAKVSPKAYYETMASARLTDYADTLKAVAAPVLVLVGDEDEFTPMAEAKFIADGIDGARLEILPHAGNLSNLDNPSGFNAVVRHFIEQQS